MSRTRKFFAMGNMIYRIGDSNYSTNDLLASIDPTYKYYDKVDRGGPLNRMMVRMYLEMPTFMDPASMYYLMTQRVYDCTTMIVFVYQKIKNRPARIWRKVYERRECNIYANKLPTAWYLKEETVVCTLPDDTLLQIPIDDTSFASAAMLV